MSALGLGCVKTISGQFTHTSECLFYPRKRTSPNGFVMSAKCH
jgi:cytochrome oxidase assembly protein ShyY1